MLKHIIFRSLLSLFLLIPFHAAQAVVINPGATFSVIITETNGPNLGLVGTGTFTVGGHNMNLVNHYPNIEDVFDITSFSLNFGGLTFAGTLPGRWYSPGRNNLTACTPSCDFVMGDSWWSTANNGTMIEFWESTWRFSDTANHSAYHAGSYSIQLLENGPVPVGNVPEPASLALLALGLIGLGLVRTSRNRRTSV